MTVQVYGDKQVADDLRDAASVYNRESTRLLKEVGVWTTGRVKAYTMDAGSVDLGELVQGIHYDIKSAIREKSVTIRPSDKADTYAIYVEEGTRPHFPPIDKLQGWADRHGIPVWAVAMKIAREGTEPRHMWRDTFDDLLSHIETPVGRFAVRLEESL
jgi:hypothetical protein